MTGTTVLYIHKLQLLNTYSNDILYVLIRRKLCDVCVVDQYFVNFDSTGGGCDCRTQDSVELSQESLCQEDVHKHCHLRQQCRYGDRRRLVTYGDSWCQDYSFQAENHTF